jgi:hypothetical protein
MNEVEGSKLRESMKGTVQENIMSATWVWRSEHKGLICVTTAPVMI